MRTAVVLSDLHVGSAFAPFPPRFELSNGSVVSLNRGQAWLWECWGHFLGRVPSQFDLLILNGDLIQGQNPHESGVGLTEPDPEWQQRAARDLLAPLADRAGAVYATKGTDYHVGEVARWEEQLAARLGTEPTESGHYAHDWLLLDVDGVRLDVAHHQSIVMRYRSMPLEREIQFDAMLADWKGGPADLIVRSHAHNYIEVHIATQQSVGLPGWQMQMPYTARSKVPNRYFATHLGGIWLEILPEHIGQPEYRTRIHPVLFRHPDMRRVVHVAA